MPKLLFAVIVSILTFFTFCFLYCGRPLWASECPCGEEQEVEQIYPYRYEAEVNTSGEINLLIDATRRTLTVLVNGQPLKTYPVALGKFATPTPLGNYRIVRKAMHWGSGFGSRWLELNVPWGLYGIHGTNKPWSIGSYASHGCIRMHNSDIEELYPLVPVGAPVIIAGNPFTYREPPYRTLRRDFCGADVLEVQRVLARLGLFKGKLDGVWRWDMEESIYTLRRQYGLPRDNAVDEAVYRALRLG